MEASCRDTVETTHVTLGLVPEVLDAVDVILLFGEELGVVDAEVLEACHVQHVVGVQRIGVDDAIGAKPSYPYFIEK